MTVVNPIEAESYRLLAQRVDLSAYGPLGRELVARVIHASADIEYATTMVVDEDSLAAGVDALRAGSPVITDVEMTRAGITGVDARCYLADAVAGEGGADTRSAAATPSVRSTRSRRWRSIIARMTRPFTSHGQNSTAA